MDQCGNCGIEIKVEPVGIPRMPCPKCGAMNRNLTRNVSDHLTVSAAVTASQVFGHTGREVLLDKSVLRAREWARLTNHDELLKHSAAQEFRDAVRAAPSLSGDVIVLFRGQGIRDTEPIPPSIVRMGPLPLDRTPGEGRYHRAGERVLYLADSVNGVLREMDAWHSEGKPFVIRIEVPLTSLKIADFSVWPTDHLVTAVFSCAENCKVPDRGPDNYTF
jgi:hypothetical protein